MAPNVEYLQNSSGDSGPDLSFDKSTSPERLFSLALVSLAEISKPVLSFGCSGGDYTSSTAKAFFFKIGDKLNCLEETEQEMKPYYYRGKEDRKDMVGKLEELYMDGKYGGNKESKKVQRTLLEQQYENFTRSSSEIMDQTFDSTNSNSSTNEADNTAYGVSAAHTQCNPTYGDNLSDAMICAFLASRPNSPQLAQEDLEQIDSDDLEEIDL
ncbi:hypothetical protein Tco_0553210 [Tanacetum coccineum]